jgi:DNA (cytosine-5)-methyltransferase 1
MPAYYNEFKPYAAEWLRNLIKKGLIPDGEVDTRSIVDVAPDDLRGFTQCHFFAGIGGRGHALRLAGWPDDRPVWTGSCPCQPFSVAGKGAGTDDPRHLWPAWSRLIKTCKPSIIFGEQVPDAIRYGWLDTVYDDLEAEGYAVGAAVLPACSVGAPHLRDRIYFLADASGKWGQPVWGQQFAEGCAKEGAIPQWAAEPGVARMVDGVRDRMALVRGYGNAIVPQVAAEVIRAFMEATEAA